MVGYRKGKMAEKPQKRQRIVLKRLVKQRKHPRLWLRKVFLKKKQTIKRKRVTGSILQKREVLDQTGRVGISTVYFKVNFSHTGNIP